MLRLAVRVGMGGLVATIVSLAVILALSLWGESPVTTAPVVLPTTDPTAPVDLSPSPLGEKVMLSKAQMMYSAQMFPQEGRGTAVVVENRNDIAVDIFIRVTLYSGQDALNLDGGPYRIDSGATILVPRRCGAEHRHGRVQSGYNQGDACQ